MTKIRLGFCTALLRALIPVLGAGISASVSLAESPSSSVISLLKNGAIRVEDSSGTSLLSHRENEGFIPASTLKVATAYCALAQLGDEYHFTTDIGISRDGGLFIRGSGDPALVSEELALLAKEIRQHTSRVTGIYIDTSLFEDDIVIDGASNSTNPYDARNAAFVGNYSSAELQRSRSGTILSAEPQTPLTPISAEVGKRLKIGSRERINLGKDWKLGARYGGELLAEFLKAEGVAVSGGVHLTPWDTHVAQTFQYTSSRSLAEIVRGMLMYSNNFTANQLFLTLGVAAHGAPATVTKGQTAMNACLRSKVGWDDFVIEEGSGLSRKNRVSAALMTRLMRAFEPHRELLKVEQGFTAKTGTLTGVNSLAGFFTLPEYGDIRFAILINSEVPPMYKFTVASAVREYLEKAR